ncbi:Clp amino terminal domain-containing protein, pathogenicity island component [Nocardia amikacinitolerans]|uniref:Clp protease N-terminal domain-containing protein n=1 Tax=Nocardia amikacinitolerans TaxID=756689 RepID=UPI000A028EDD|nr:Clp protease N-terminal domain-containing protein [Nocardia amikacinitolerans]MCP2315352.1 Clp amino terminal domain-containing protein, pathogenicity island component [Nocardia amikacinitolerans]
MTEGWPSSISSFDDIFQRFFGSGMMSQPPVRHLLYAATESEPGRSIIAELGHDPDKVANQMRDAADTGEPAEDADEQVTSSPGAKLALRAAQRRAADAGSSYIGPEHILLGIASVSDSPAARVLLSGPKTATAGRPAKSETPTLDEYGRDVTAEARAGNLDPVVGRAEEIEQTVEILFRRRKNHPVLIGDPGVGKTAIEHRGKQTVEAGV